MTNFLILVSIILLPFHTSFMFCNPISRISKNEARKLSPSNKGSDRVSSGDNTFTAAPPNDEKFELRKKLQQVFQLDSAALQRPKPENPESAPEYMLDLYKQTADLQSGLTKGENPYGANLVRSFNNKGPYKCILDSNQLFIITIVRIGS